MYVLKYNHNIISFRYQVLDSNRSEVNDIHFDSVVCFLLGFYIFFEY